MVDYSKFDNIVDSDDETPLPKKTTPTPASSSSASSAPSNDTHSEVEKLKQKKRLERAAREAEELKNPTAKKEEPIPTQAQPELEPEPAPSAIQQLTSAESDVESMKIEIAAVCTSLTSTPPPSADSEEKRLLKLRISALMSNVGKLQNKIDDIYLGDVEDEGERGEAKSRRKALNALLEGEITSAVGELRKL